MRVHIHGVKYVRARTLADSMLDCMFDDSNVLWVVEEYEVRALARWTSEISATQTELIDK